jgi:subtilisin family serine protease
MPSVSEVAKEMLESHGKGRLKHLLNKALLGFSVTLTEQEASFLADDYRVDFVEEDGIVELDAEQTGATWGLDRVDQRDLPLDQVFRYDQTGASVHAYVVDTGLRSTHVEFLGRVGNGYTAIDDGNGISDCHGHGTHTSGTIGGTTYGVAKSVVIHPVRVLSCSGSGTVSGVIAGIDWVTQNHIAPAVAIMSLAGGPSSSLDQALANSVAAGVTYAVSAGNSNADACNQSPARAPAALTVGATTSHDARASYSNWGTCVDPFAPGSSVRSAYYTSDTATATMSGTSMASPHVAGAAALYLETNPTAGPAAVAQAVVAQATLDHVGGAGTGSPNLLLYTRFEGGSSGDTTPPVTSIASPASGATVAGIMGIQANATDASGVTAVKFYVNGGVVCTDTTAPYTCSWDTTVVADGAYTLMTKASDPSKNVGESSAVGVTVDNTPPLTAITSPPNGATVAGTVVTEATATDVSGVAAVEFYMNGGIECTDATAPYTCSWDSLAIANGRCVHPHSQGQRPRGQHR